MQTLFVQPRELGDKHLVSAKGMWLGINLNCNRPADMNMMWDILSGYKNGHSAFTGKEKLTTVTMQLGKKIQAES